MRIGSLLAAVVLPVLLTTPALALEVSKSATVAAKPADLWAEIGDFCAIGDWHPAVAECEETRENGETVRTLTLEGGGTIRERLVEATDTGYSYEILESPLPVRNYRSTLSVSGEADGTRIDWKGSFVAHDASDADAAGIIEGIYQAGLDSIAKGAGN
ncbi:SRPBCC family protein [Faunimonas sp. B44]|uniref:SRPBCC family protein n=1 Tax=Faunimonas sp. B44 TaxID=3461493 RepID=UPI0040442EF9